MNWYICELSDGNTFNAYAPNEDEAILDANYTLRNSDGVYALSAHINVEGVLL